MDSVTVKMFLLRRLLRFDLPEPMRKFENDGQRVSSLARGKYGLVTAPVLYFENQWLCPFACTALSPEVHVRR